MLPSERLTRSDTKQLPRPTTLGRRIGESRTESCGFVKSAQRAKETFVAAEAERKTFAVGQSAHGSIGRITARSEIHAL